LPTANLKHFGELSSPRVGQSATLLTNCWKIVQ